MTVQLWRIASESPNYKAIDRTGKGAEVTGGRWNQKGTPMLYAATSISLAVLEVVVHLPQAPFPLNRYLIQIDVPDDVWEARASIDYLTAPGGWDAEPTGLTSREFGDVWAKSGGMLLQAVPSTMVPREQNVLINPYHPDAVKLTITNTGKFLFDGRTRSP